MKPVRCDMVRIHHTDCECQWCRSRLDERCQEPAVGTVSGSGGLRVCEECAIGMHQEEFTVVYDDRRLGIAS